MMSLEKVQKVMEVLKIISKIVVIVTIVCLALVFVSGIVVLLSGSIPFASALQKALVESDLMTNKELSTILFIECIPLALCIFASVRVYQYFKKETIEGTPFTHEGSKRIFRLGILSFILFLVSAIINAIVEEFFFFPLTEIESVGSVSLGLCLLFLSLIVQYGAELEEKVKGKA